MQCNIDARGKAVRLVVGALMAFAGGGLLLMSVTGILEHRFAVIAGAALVLGGGFGVIEGLAGWCVIRAMGWRTPL